MSSSLKITLTSGLVGKKDTQKRIIAALGLRKYGSSVVHLDSPTILGMLDKVHHLVTVSPADGAPAKKAEAKSAKKPAAKATAEAPKKAAAPKKEKAAAN